MARRDNGTGTVYQRPNGSWVGRIYTGRGADGKPKYKCFSGKSQAEVKRKIKEFNQGGCKTDSAKVSVEEYILNWLKLYKKGSIKDSSYDAIEKTVRNHIIPALGMIQLQKLGADDIQLMISDMKEKQGYSYSTVKKAYDCMRQVLTHATVKEDIVKNPILLVKMPDKRPFPRRKFDSSIGKNVCVSLRSLAEPTVTENPSMCTVTLTYSVFTIYNQHTTTSRKESGLQHGCPVL